MKTIIKTPYDQSKRLEMLKIPYLKTITNNTLMITTETTKYVKQNNDIPISVYPLLKEIAKFVDALPEIKQPEYPDYVKYIFLDKCIKSPFVNGTDIYKKYYNFTEIDISGAYWEAAYKLGVIEKTLYLKLCNPDKCVLNKKKIEPRTAKQIRLIVLGSLATKKSVYIFNGEEILTPEPTAEQQQKEEHRRNYYLLICKEIDNIIKKCISELGTENFLFFWIDAVFCKNNIAESVKYFFEMNGYNTKEKKILWLQRIKMQTHEYLHLQTGSKKEDYKCFFITNEKKDKERADEIKEAIKTLVFGEIEHDKKNIQEKIFSVAEKIK